MIQEGVKLGTTEGYRKQVIIMGKGVLAIRIAEWFFHAPAYQLVCIVPFMPEPQWTRSVCSWAREKNIPLVESGNYEDIPQVKNKEWNIDLVFSVFYDKIIKEWFIAKCGKILNLHNSSLPKYRGVSPINWALKNNEQMQGVTIHEITPQIDAGPIVAKLEYSIYPELDEVIDVYNRSLEYGWVLFQQTMPLIEKIRPILQNESAATYYNSNQNKLLGERRDFTREISKKAHL